jgi:S1-C subfamily serine protease
VVAAALLSRRPASSATKWMTRFHSSFAAISLSLMLAGCAHSSGAPALLIAEPGIASAYLPLYSRVHLGLDSAVGAAVVIAPGIAVTNAHNKNLLDEKSVLGVRRDYDLLFFRTSRRAAPETAEPVIGEAVTAYGQGADRELRVAKGVVRTIQRYPGLTAPAYFTFAGNAGPGFSGGPVIDAAGKLIGITFGYKDEGGERRIYAYDMSRVRAEVSALPKGQN